MSEGTGSANLEEAARWFAALRRGVMTIEERRAFEAWRGNSANRAALGELEQLWIAVGSAQASGIAAALPDRGQRAIGRPALVAAMCALSLVIGALSYSGNSSFWTTLDWTDR